MFAILSILPILLIPIIALYSVLNHIHNSHFFKKHLRCPSVKGLQETLIPQKVSNSIKTGFQTLKDIQKINIEINGHEIDTNDIEAKLNKYNNYRNAYDIPQRMLYHIEYISNKCKITHKQTREIFFDRISLALVLEDLISEYTHKTTNNIPNPKPNPKIIHEIITRCNKLNYLNVPKQISSNILNLEDNPFLIEQKHRNIQISLDTILFTPQNSNTMICTITEELPISETQQKYLTLDQETSNIISSLRFTLDAESQDDSILYNNISFELSIPNNLKRYTTKTHCRNFIKKSNKTHAILSEIDTYNGRTYFLYDFPKLQSSNLLSLTNNDITYSEYEISTLNISNSLPF
ncbi:hypothetical protein [Ehrlichia ruminantium]|nr:hypothetical protein [Ehrlichia ruminantium]